MRTDCTRVTCTLLLLSGVSTLVLKPKAAARRHRAAGEVHGQAAAQECGEGPPLHSRRQPSRRMRSRAHCLCSGFPPRWHRSRVHHVASVQTPWCHRHLCMCNRVMLKGFSTPHPSCLRKGGKTTGLVSIGPFRSIDKIRHRMQLPLSLHNSVRLQTILQPRFTLLRTSPAALTRLLRRSASSELQHSPGSVTCV